MPHDVFFLHFPKCGSSFHNTVTRFACRGVPDDCVLVNGGCNHTLANGKRVAFLADERSCSPSILCRFTGWCSHSPLKSLAEAPQAVALFRQPRMRLLASVRHPNGAPKSYIRTIRNSTLTHAEVARLPGKLGCMTKMLTGMGCATPVLNKTEYTAITDRFIQLRRAGDIRSARAVLDESVDRERRLLMNRVPNALAAIDALLFVGMTEQWELSVALFHAKVAKDRKVVAAELHNMRPGAFSPFYDPTVKVQTELHNRTLDLLQPPHVYDARALDGVWDPADEQVFLAAERRMSLDASALMLSR